MLNWLSAQFNALRRRGLRPAPHVAAVAVHNTMNWVDPALTNHTYVYQQSPWVYVAVNRIAEAAALVPLQVFKLEGERRIGVERHPLEVLLDSPNPYCSVCRKLIRPFKLDFLLGEKNYGIPDFMVIQK